MESPFSATIIAENGDYNRRFQSPKSATIVGYIVAGRDRLKSVSKFQRQRRRVLLPFQEELSKDTIAKPC